MKQKLFMMLAALMLLGTSAMAQSETLKGDVNGDGAVDVADIAAVIQIMKDNGDIETKYYWYVGWTKPTSLSHLQTLAVESQYSHGGSTTSASGAKLLTNSTTINNPAGVKKDLYYVVIPTGYEIYDATLPNDPITNNSFTLVTDVIIDKHKIYQSNSGAYRNSGLEIY